MWAKWSDISNDSRSIYRTDESKIKDDVRQQVRAKDDARVPARVKPADPLINIRCPRTRHVQVRPRWPMDGSTYKRTTEPHTRDTRTLPISYPSNTFPSRRLRPCDIPVVAVFGNAWCVTKSRDHLRWVSSSRVRTSRLLARDAHLPVRLFVRLGPILQSLLPGVLMTEKTGLITGGWVYGMEKGDAGYCRDRNTPQYCRTSRERDDVSDLLVLIKKSHKAPPGRDIAAGARYIITMIYRVLPAAVRRTFAEAVKDDWKHLQA